MLKIDNRYVRVAACKAQSTGTALQDAHSGRAS